MMLDSIWEPISIPLTISNSLKKKSSLSKVDYQNPSILENNGQNVNLSRKSEINVTVDHAGPSPPLKPCLIESVLPQDKLTKLDSHLKT